MASPDASSSRPDTAPAGYSGTPLAKKLSLAPGMRVWFHAMPGSVRAEIDPAAIGVVEVDAPVAGLDAAHLFVTDRAELERLIAQLRTMIAPTGQIWVSWPKKASKVPTDVTEDVIRAVVLPTGLVDVKVCAIDAIWSGLKLMIRRELR
ncbi:MAG TPA: hypothetical protein VF485_04690 [Sphingomonas sp.]